MRKIFFILGKCSEAEKVLAEDFAKLIAEKGAVIIDVRLLDQVPAIVEIFKRIREIDESEQKKALTVYVFQESDLLKGNLPGDSLDLSLFFDALIEIAGGYETLHQKVTVRGLLHSGVKALLKR